MSGGPLNALSQSAASATYAPAFVCAAPTGVAATDTAEISAKVALAVAAVAATGGTARVLFRPGTYKTNTAITYASGITYEGAGKDVTIIRPQDNHGFAGDGTIGAPITNARISKLTLDGQDITTSHTYKGHYSSYLLNCQWSDAAVRNFTATGWGADFLVGSTYSYCEATNNGRGQTVGSPGMSGFGIGTGAYQVEDTLVIGCKATGNLNYGVFFERQDLGAGTFMVRGPKVIGCTIDGGNWGIGDAGCEGLVVEGNSITGAAAAGIVVNQGSGTGAGLGRPGYRYLIRGNYVTACTGHGIHLNYSVNSITAALCYALVEGNIVIGNTGSGIRVDGSKWASDKVKGLRIRGNTIRGNSASGIYMTTTVAGGDGGGDIYDARVEDNMILANGQASTAGDNHGIAVYANTTRLGLRDNKITDDGSPKKQAYGVYTDAANTHTDADVIGNSLRGNLTGSASFGATWAGTTRVIDNLGYNPVGISSVSLGASPATYTAGVTKEDFYMAGGTVTAVKVTPAGGSQFTLLLSVSGGALVHLEPGDAIEITYSVIPTSTKVYKL